MAQEFKIKWLSEDEFYAEFSFSQAEIWEASLADTFQIIIKNAPNLKVLDLSKCPSLTWLYLVNLPQLEEVILPNHFLNELGFTGQKLPNFVVNGQVSLFSVWLPNNSFEIKSPKRMPWRNIQVIAGKDLNNLQALSNAELLIAQGDATTNYQDLRFNNTRYFLWLSPSNLTSLNIGQANRLQTLSIKNASKLKFINTQHRVKKLLLDAPASLRQIEGRIELLKISNYHAPRELHLFHLIDVAEFSYCNFKKLNAPLVQKLTFKGCNKLEKMHLYPRCWPSYVGFAPYLIQGRHLKKLLGQLVLEAQPEAVYSSLKQLLELAKQKANPELIWEARLELAARNYFASYEAPISEEDKQQVAQYWCWNTQDLDAYKADWEIYLACKSYFKARSYTRIIRNSFTQAKPLITEEKPKFRSWVNYWLKNHQLDIPLVQEVILAGLKQVNFANPEYQDLLQLEIELLVQLELSFAVLPYTAKGLKAHLLIYKALVLHPEVVFAKGYELLNQNLEAGRRFFQILATKSVRFWQKRISEQEAKKLIHQARVIMLTSACAEAS